MKKLYLVKSKPKEPITRSQLDYIHAYDSDYGSRKYNERMEKLLKQLNEFLPL